MQETNGDGYLNRAKNIVLESVFCQNILAKRKTQVNDKNLQKCVDYMNENLSRQIVLEQLCSFSGYSKTTFIEKFKRQYTMTPIQYLNKARIDAAKVLLLDFELSIGAIAEKCGFNCPYYFSNTFRKHCGESPLQYRKKHLL